MADTKQTKTIAEHHVASELARRGWAPALTRDGLERTDILAVDTAAVAGGDRRMIEVQVKGARGARMDRISWPLGEKSQEPSASPREYFVMVAIPHDESAPIRSFIVPRIHVAAAAWIEHMAWLTDSSVAAGTRNAGVDRARVFLGTFEPYEDRWDLLNRDQATAPVLLPSRYRQLAQENRVGLPPGHEWRAGLPDW